MENVKRHPFRVWLCYFIAVNIIIGLLLAALFCVFNDNIRTELDIALDLTFSKDVRDSILFKEDLANLFSSLANISGCVPELDNQNTASYWGYRSIQAEESNIACLVVNKAGETIYNTLPSKAEMNRYDRLLYADKDTLNLYFSDNTNVIDKYLSGTLGSEQYSFDRSYKQLIDNYNSFAEQYSDNTDVTLVMAITSDADEISTSTLYGVTRAYKTLRLVAIVFSTVLFIEILLIIYISIKRNDRLHFTASVAAIQSRIWIEVKFIVFMLIMTFPSVVFGHNYAFYSHNDVTIIALIFILFWSLYFLLADLRHNHLKFFTHNSINSFIKFIKKLDLKTPLQKRLSRRFWLFIAVEAILAILFFITLNSFAFLFFLLGIILIVVYANRFHLLISDLGKITYHVARIKSGDLVSPHNLNHDSDLFQTGEQLNSLQSGMSAAVEQRIQSERMKIELITNVSHDLKTPLTSIISYVDLLEREELPPPADEYVHVLSQKAQRLKTMISDIFDVSKASSGNLPVDMITLELARLVEQTIADMDEDINKSGLTFKTRFPEELIYIQSDGDRLYRVLQNLIDNTLRYSLTGSRVYITISSNKDTATLEIKNTSSHDLGDNNTDLTERFVRGDESRSTEGSGLGLSIAQTFTEACGGTFTISTDDDIFKVTLDFPKRD